LRSCISVGRLFACSLLLTSTCATFAQTNTPKQVNDEDYTKKIKEYLSDPRFTTELVDHLPASSKVPTPLKFLGSMPGQPGELYYTADINRYCEELAKDSPRAKFWKFGMKSEEGRDMVVLAIGNEESIRNLEKIQSRSGGTHPKGLPSQNSDAEAARQAIRQFGGTEDTSPAPRIVLRFPAKPMKSSSQESLPVARRSPIVRSLSISPLGQGHMVMFALRPFWRWQTQGTYALGFNTILNWDHLDAGKKETKPQSTSAIE
jgi:hypothetical protein